MATLILCGTSVSSPLVESLSSTWEYKIVNSTDIDSLELQDISYIFLLDATVLKHSDLIGMIRRSTSFSNSGIIVLSESSSELMEPKILKQGADLFFSPPFQFSKIKAYIESLFRRIEGFPEGSQEHQIQVKMNERVLNWKQTSYPLTPTQCRLSSLFIKYANRPLSRSQIKREIWKGLDISDRSIDAQISKLKKAVPPFEKRIESLYGKGYKLTLTDKDLLKAS